MKTHSYEQWTLIVLKVYWSHHHSDSGACSANQHWCCLLNSILIWTRYDVAFKEGYSSESKISVGWRYSLNWRPQVIAVVSNLNCSANHHWCGLLTCIFLSNWKRGNWRYSRLLYLQLRRFNLRHDILLAMPWNQDVKPKIKYKERSKSIEGNLYFCTADNKKAIPIPRVWLVWQILDWRRWSLSCEKRKPKRLPCFQSTRSDKEFERKRGKYFGNNLEGSTQNIKLNALLEKIQRNIYRRSTVRTTTGKKNLAHLWNENIGKDSEPTIISAFTRRAGGKQAMNYQIVKKRRNQSKFVSVLCLTIFCEMWRTVERRGWLPGA